MFIIPKLFHKLEKNDNKKLHTKKDFVPTEALLKNKNLQNKFAI
jgi:hypothetical protein